MKPVVVDWVHYIQREAPLYLFYANIKDYGQKLGEVTNYGIRHQLYVYDKTIGTFYMSASELNESEIHIFSLIKNKDPRITEWLNQGKRYNSIAQETLKVHAKIMYNEAAELFENVLFWGTILPFRVLSAFDRAENNGEDITKYSVVISEFKSLRSKSLYPRLLSEVFPSFWKEAAKKARISNWYLCSTLTLPEMDHLIKERTHPNVQEMKQRIEWCAFWEENRNIRFSYNQKIIQSLGITLHYDETTEVTGRVAFPGYVKGIVRVINRLEDASDFNNGEILVSINTNPSLMPLINKCGAIVTDEGGMGCHAAIVSRELGKPCIVGTKAATKVFKDGDLVEVDANHGVVKKLK